MIFNVLFVFPGNTWRHGDRIANAGELEMTELESSRTHLVRSAGRRQALMYPDTSFGNDTQESPSRAVRALTDSLRRRPHATSPIYRSISQVKKICKTNEIFRMNLKYSLLSVKTISTNLVVDSKLTKGLFCLSAESTVLMNRI